MPQLKLLGCNIFLANQECLFHIHKYFGITISKPHTSMSTQSSTHAPNMFPLIFTLYVKMWLYGISRCVTFLIRTNLLMCSPNQLSLTGLLHSRPMSNLSMPPKLGGHISSPCDKDSSGKEDKYIITSNNGKHFK